MQGAGWSKPEYARRLMDIGHFGLAATDGKIGNFGIKGNDLSRLELATWDFQQYQCILKQLVLLNRYFCSMTVTSKMDSPEYVSNTESLAREMKESMNLENPQNVERSDEEAPSHPHRPRTGFRGPAPGPDYYRDEHFGRGPYHDDRPFDREFSREEHRDFFDHPRGAPPRGGRHGPHHGRGRPSFYPPPPPPPPKVEYHFHHHEHLASGPGYFGPNRDFHAGPGDRYGFPSHNIPPFLMENNFRTHHHDFLGDHYDTFRDDHGPFRGHHGPPRDHHGPFRYHHGPPRDHHSPFLWR
ncbi:LAME_0F16094g1_1 [Lachancea meyersii CBS 8951]|uniref:LAME_0F16094g1_1 n=1 Tax=Lachancea meyersii CBS 8951 TaxID=1266667 RepID=A0A1G4JYX6_9SACH|nr:LAME_0F16094g1_1 [Lachancea meyersii CBS 8951]